MVLLDDSTSLSYVLIMWFVCNTATSTYLLENLINFISTAFHLFLFYFDEYYKQNDIFVGRLRCVSKRGQTRQGTVHV